MLPISAFQTIKRHIVYKCSLLISFIILMVFFKAFRLGSFAFKFYDVSISVIAFRFLTPFMKNRVMKSIGD